jgi:tRNA modification GTPase
MDSEDDIFALASGHGRAALAVIRMSGNGTLTALCRLCGVMPKPRRNALFTLRDKSGEALDQAIVLWNPGPRSYTGEDCAELHIHGGLATLDAVSQALSSLGFRPAEPGEFTRRAFVHGKLGLSEAEAVADLIDAETEAQRKQAMRQMEGGLERQYAAWADRLMLMLAQQEALIDFPEEDLPEDEARRLNQSLHILADEVAQHLQSGIQGERLRSGLVFAIIGPPNVGKSSLINSLVGRDIAIVSPRPGTTRDALEARAVFGGVPVTLVDTAGLRDAADEIEAEGIRRARMHAERADAVIAVTSADGAPYQIPAGALHVINKIDAFGPGPASAINISAQTGVGLNDLRETLDATARALTAHQGPPPLTSARQRAALEIILPRLRAALLARDAELRAEDLRMAMRALGRLTGRVDVEDVLNVIFARFCIGK